MISLIIQIVYAHRKSFTDEKFEAIKSIFVSSQGTGMTVILLQYL